MYQFSYGREEYSIVRSVSNGCETVVHLQKFSNPCASGNFDGLSGKTSLFYSLFNYFVRKNLLFEATDMLENL